MQKVLFTRKLSWSEKIRCLNRGIIPIVKPMIRIEPIKLNGDQVNLISSNGFPYFVFTSKNAVRFFLNTYKNEIPGIDLAGVEFIVIGKKTGGLLKDFKNKQHVFQFAGEQPFERFVAEKTQGKPYLYFCSDIASIKWRWKSKHENAYILENYRTISTGLKVDMSKCRKVVFMSSSAVNSFFQCNTLDDEVRCYVIGEPTRQTILNYHGGVVLKSMELSFDGIVSLVV